MIKRVLGRASGYDGIDPDQCNALAMTPTAFVTLATLFLENDDLVILLQLDDGSLDGCTFDEWSTVGDSITLTDHENLSNFDGITRIGARKLIYLDHVVLFDGELSTLCFDCGFHGKESMKRKLLANARIIR
jgi:hypothetical protein